MDFIAIKGWIKVFLGDIKCKNVVMKTFYITTHDGNITDYNIYNIIKNVKYTTKISI